MTPKSLHRRIAKPERSRNDAVLERMALAACLAALFCFGYFGLGRSGNPTLTHALVTSLDARIPFVAVSVWAYLWAFPAAFLPLFVVRCPRLLRRTALAYATVMAVSFACFAEFPVTSAGLRASPALLAAAGPSGRIVSVLYAFDQPHNLFPSLHVSIAALAAFALWKSSRPWGVTAFVSATLVAVSACTVKQHFLADVLGGVALAAFTAALLLEPRLPQPDPG
jgi:membrane-associated phospholipid phosphatase